MTYRLILIRHAKSSWDDLRLEDHERRLNPRGTAAAFSIGKWLNTKGYIPDAILTSSARRTLETWQGLAASLPEQTDITVTRSLFHPQPQQMQQVLKTATAPCVLMLSHNPGICQFAETLLAIQPDIPAFHRYPTCATSIIDFPINSWSNLHFNTGRLIDFTTPKSLP